MLDSIDTDLKDSYVYSASNLIAQFFTGASESEREDVLLRKYVAIHASDVSVGSATDFGGGYSTSAFDSDVGIDPVGFTTDLALDTFKIAAAAVGGAFKAPGAAAEGKMIREGVKLFQALILMAFVCFLPFILVASLYRLSVLMTLSLVFFALHFLSFVFGIAFWLDNNLISALSSGPNTGAVFSPILNPTQTIILAWASRLFYIFLPMMFSITLTWIGIKISGAVGAIGEQSQSAASVGKAGGDLATDLVVGAVTKGKGGK